MPLLVGLKRPHPERRHTACFQGWAVCLLGFLIRRRALSLSMNFLVVLGFDLLLVNIEVFS